MIEIRQYQPSDAEEVHNLHILGLQQTGAYVGSGPWDADLDQIEQVYLRNNGEFLVGTVEGRLIAMGALKRTTSERAEIKRMRVHPDVQGRGIGQQIVTLLEQRARAFGYTTLHLDTMATQIAAQRLYRKNGFQETHRTFIKGMECLFLEKSLL